ncbi:MAG: S-layer homology domain-containing protein [Clostridia bacterium]|nr:S-layer homology domain-containing protein [Clostridia bacterium]
MIKSILSSVLCMTILVSVLCVPSFADDKTEIVEMIFEEDFESGVIDESRMVFGFNNSNPSVNQDPSVRIEDGKLKFERYDNSGCNAYMRYFFNEDHSALSDGLYCIEYDIHKSNHRNVWVRIYNGDYEFTREMWRYSNDFCGSTVMYTENHHFKFFLDTIKSVYYVWVDGVLLASEKTTYNAGQKAFTGIGLPLEGGDAGKCIVSLDNLKVYKTTYTDQMLVDMDTKAMTVSSLLTAAPNILGETCITTDLNLYTETLNGCSVTWTSSDNSIIDPESGKIYRSAEDKTATVTATVTKGEASAEKSFEFTLLAFTEDYLTVEKDSDLVTYQSMTDENPDELTTSLNFIADGAYGSEIVYTSDNTDVITESGRVIRPWVGEPDEKVTITATVKCGVEALSKEFTFTVKAEDALLDPMDMSDEDFFGVYDKASGEWINKGVFDYDCQNELADMSEIESAVMDGDYDRAKEEFLTYMRERKPYVVRTKSRNTLQANAATTDLAFKSSIVGEAFVGGEWSTVEAPLSTSILSVEKPVSVDLVAAYNESSMAEIMTKESGNAPILRLTVNGNVRDFEAIDDGYIRLGSYSDENYGREDKMYVKMQGADLGDETYRSKIKFDISSLKTLSGITSAKLVFKAKASLVNNEKKRITIIGSYSTLWEEENLVFKSHVYDYKSFNGQPGGIDWGTFSNADVEYMYQIGRFPWLTSMIYEYEYSGEEIYAYRAIRQLMDFINDCGSKGWYDGQGPIGQYPRSLDATERLAQLLTVIDTLCESEYMTPDSCTAIMKHLWHIAEASRTYHSTSGNWAQSIMMYLYRAAYAFPEFAAANGTNGSEVNWTEYAHNYSIKLMENNYYEDGTYIEPTGGYSSGSHKGYIGTYGEMKNKGYSISDVALKKLYDGTYYNLLSFAPGGMTYAYGDSGYSAGSSSRQYPDSDEIFGDDELTYIDSYGAKGTKPTWTSKQFPIGKYTFMRSDWTDTSLYLATQVRGYEYGSHGHADRNHVTVAAFGKLLLTDAGSFTYTSGALRELGRSTKMHNTVSINDGVQDFNENATPEAIEKYGKIHNWQTNSAYDFLSQSTTSNEGFNHTRTILFVKPYYWIVSDYIDPDDDSAENDIKQNWHMMPTAKMTVDAENNVMYSNNDDNINITVASADSDANALEEAEGYWAQSIGSPTENPYGYFNKIASGDVTFDTALVPTNSADSNVKVERLSTGTDTTVSTALKLTTVTDGSETNGYYYLSYEDGAKDTRSFGDYSTNGQMAFVHEDVDGNADMVIMNDATVVKKNGKVLLESEDRLSDISVSLSGSRMDIQSSQDISLSNLKVYSPFDIKSVYVNNVKTKFTTDGRYITYDKDAGSDVSSGSSSGGSWGVSGGSTSVPSVPVTPTPPVTGGETVESTKLADISGHWAESDITALYNAGIIKGKQDGIFAPEDSITRSEFIALIVRVLGVPKSAISLPYSDVSESDWYFETLKSALGAGLISSDSAFRPNDIISREEMAAILARSYNWKFPPFDASKAKLSFTDKASIAPWAEASVKLTSSIGLINGMSDGSFAPKATATRAQAATVIYRFREMMK